MVITANGLGKQYAHGWVFRQLNYTFTQGNTYAILGNNGSGKSTLQQIIAGSLNPTEGRVQYLHNTPTVNFPYQKQTAPLTDYKPIPPELWYKYIAWAAPSLQLMQEFTATEIFNFQKALKPFLPAIDKQAFFEILQLSGIKNKALYHYSSGMRQRVGLALAFLAKTPILLLDEPTSNLDTQGKGWYLEMVDKYAIAYHKTIIIASNQAEEYPFCKHQLQIQGGAVA